MSNSGITLIDVRSQAMDVIQGLKDGKIDVRTAKEIKGLLDIIVDTAKTQVSFINALPQKLKEEMSEDSIKTIAGTLQDKDAELDRSLAEIKQRENSYYCLSKK